MTTASTETPDTSSPAPGATAAAGADHDRILRVAIPVTVFVLALVAWEALVRINGIPHYILPSPSRIGAALVEDRAMLADALWVTLKTTIIALTLATAGGVALAILFAQARWIELSFFPFAVILQVTPIVAIAPLLLVWLDTGEAMLVCAFIVAFFPILSNTALGLASADHNLRDLMKLYGASRWQDLMLLRLPAALPYFLGGLRIGGGLALIGAIVAEIAAGTTGKGAGLAVRIVEAGYRLNIPRMFAALFLISITGVIIYLALSLLSHLLLRRWHESALERR
jgi:NitT/TauT family transport system permease protein